MPEPGSQMVRDAWQAVLAVEPVAGLDDEALLDRFARSEGDAAEVAFAALVARHGPMVRAVCRQWLADPHDADDAWQATFLVLARKAGSLRHPERLAGWLYGTAHRAARRLRADRTRRQRHEAARPAVAQDPRPDQAEAVAALLDEVARLPQACRNVVVLCGLEAMTQDQAARQLGCSERTLRRRLNRAHTLLRARLTRRGLAAPLAFANLRSTPVPESLIQATARLAARSASGASATTLTLTTGVISIMNRIWWQRLGLVVGALVVAVGGGIGGMAAWQAQPPAVPTGSNLPPDPPPRLVGAPLTPSERYQALLTKYNAALKAYQAAVAQAETDAARTEAYKLSPNPADHSPGFVALAEEFPADPVAVDALLWVAQQGLSSVNPPADPGAKAFAQALLILARDHADEPRVGAYCPELTRFVDPIKDDFLRTVAARSRDRVVRGRATLALASYLRQKAALAEMFQHPDQPVRFDDLIPSGLPADQRPPLPADLVAYRGQVEAMYTKFHPAFVGTLKQADVAALRAEADRDYERVLTEFATVPAVAYDPKQTPESLADLVRRERQPRPPAKPVVPPPVDPGAERFAALVRRYDAAIARASAAGEAAGPGVPAVRAYMAAQPRWGDFGPELIDLSTAAPPSDSARSALLWTVARQGTFADAAEGRATQLGAAVDGLIRDHLAWIGTHLDDPAVQAATNFGESFPAPHVDRLYAALTEHGPSPEARGRSSLLHARHRQAEADLVASFEARGADPARRPEIALFASSYLDHLRAIGAGPLAADAVTRFEQLRRDYGTLSAGPTGETLATVADRALFDLHHLALGAVAPPIHGTDIAGQPMQLADFRGRVVVLDFGSHDRCGACRLLYPRQRELVAKYPSDRFALLGVQSHDPIGTLRDLAARREITWRCWSDSTTPDQAGPITTQWNIHRFPTFILLDANGVIRSKDLHPLDPEFERTIDRLIIESAQP